MHGSHSKILGAKYTPSFSEGWWPNPYGVLGGLQSPTGWEAEPLAPRVALPQEPHGGSRPTAFAPTPPCVNIGGEGSWWALPSAARLLQPCGWMQM